MGGELKNRIRTNVTFDTELFKKLKAYSESSMIPMSRIVERATRQYIERNANK